MIQLRDQRYYSIHVDSLTAFNYAKQCVVTEAKLICDQVHRSESVRQGAEVINVQNVLDRVLFFRIHLLELWLSIVGGLLQWIRALIILHYAIDLAFKPLTLISQLVNNSLCLGCQYVVAVSHARLLYL